MADWIEIELGDVLDVVRNGTSTTQVRRVTSFPVTRIETISDWNIDYQKVGYVEKTDESYRLQKGDILFSNINSVKHIGKLAMYDGLKPLYHGMNLLLLRLKDDVSKKYFTYLLTFNKKWFENRASQAVNQASINQASIKELPLLIPKNKQEQSTIATILTTIDQAIEKTEQLIAKYERIKTGLMQDLLTRGIDEQGNIRSEETHEFKDSVLGRIPKEWKTYKTYDLGDWKGGKTPRKSISKYWDNGKRLWYSSKDVVGDLLNDSFYKITDDAITATNQSVFPTFESLIFVFRSGILRHTFPISRSEKSFSVNQDLKVLTPNGKFSSDFLFQKFKSLEPYFLKVAVKAGTTVESVDGNVFFNTEIGIPDPREQERITKVLKNVDVELESSIFEQVKYKRLKTALMQDLLSGKVRVDALIK